MEKTKIKNENFYVIQGWMVNELGIKGNELNIYAIIYGFSQEENSWFEGSLQYLIDWTGLSKKTIITSLVSLIEKDLIDKKEEIKNNIKFCKYKCKNYTSGVKITPPSVKITPNNIVDNNNNNNIYINIKEIEKEKIYKKEKEKEKKAQFEIEFDTLWKQYPNKKGKAKALEQYIKARTNGTTFEEIEQGLKDYLIYCRDTEWYTPKDGSTWFNAKSKCWEDVYNSNVKNSLKQERKNILDQMDLSDFFN